MNMTIKAIQQADVCEARKVILSPIIQRGLFSLIKEYSFAN